MTEQKKPRFANGDRPETHTLHHKPKITPQGQKMYIISVEVEQSDDPQENARLGAEAKGRVIERINHWADGEGLNTQIAVLDAVTITDQILIRASAQAARRLQTAEIEGITAVEENISYRHL